MKTDTKARYQGYTFYFKEGFCWNNVLTTFIRCRIKQKTVQSTESMSFFSIYESVPEYYMITIMNSYFAAYYIDSFVNSTSHCTTGDAKLIPIIIPTKEQLALCKSLFDKIIKLKKVSKKSYSENEISTREINIIEKELDKFVCELYAI
ncbi:MAG: DNA modification methylase [Prevotellaceae bacterium]|nr:DNA modification methylase [Prevotellaceae bacterium]